MRFEFTGKVWVWKGPAPWHFVTVPAKQSRDLKAILGLVTYGWGMVPVQAQVGRTKWKTSMWYKDGRYVLPLKASVRQAEKIKTGDKITVRLDVH